jgi:hypothetical protein
MSRLSPDSPARPRFLSLFHSSRSPKPSRFRVFSDNLIEKFRLFGENLFSDPTPPSETPIPCEPQSFEIARRWPFVLHHVDLRSPYGNNLTISQKRFAQTMSSITALSDNILIRQNSLSKSRRKIPHKIETLLKNSSAPLNLRSIRLVYLELRDELFESENSYFSELREEILILLNFVTELRKEYPTAEIEVRIDSFFQKINGFPSANPTATKLRRQIAQLKEKRTVVKIPKRSVQERLDFVFGECATVYDNKLLYFPDVGSIGIEFLNVLDEFSASFHRKMKHRITKCITEPNRAGIVLLDQCEEITKHKGSMQVYMFLLFTRLYFSEIYLKSIVGVSADTIEFQSRIYHLRKLAPIGFNFVEKYLEPIVMTLRFVDFNRDNEYEQAVSLFGEMNFVLCPIDFCMKAFKALEIIQEVACTIACRNHMKRTNQVVTKSDYSLNYDELFEISLIVWLISDPIDTLSLITDFEPFINGLHLTASMNWAFTFMKGMCEFVMGLDINDFVNQARQKLFQQQGIIDD